MSRRFSQHRSPAFTLVELMVVMAVLLFVALMFFPAMQGNRVTAPRMNCINNLKQVGLSFRTWALDNNDLYPMRVANKNGGTLEQVEVGPAYMHFRVLSNELSTPKILRCPSDVGKTSAPAFDSKFNNQHVSYFVGVAASETNVQMFLAGDWNITNGNGGRRFLNLTTNSPAGWTEKGHVRQGNIGLADGSVQQFSINHLREAIAATGDPTNRIALP